MTEDEDEDGLDVRSKHSYARTETSESSDDDEDWSSLPRLLFDASNFQTSPTPTLPATPPPSQLGPLAEARHEAQKGRSLYRQHGAAIPLASSPTLELPGANMTCFVVVTRQVVNGLNSLTGLPVRRTKRYRVRAAGLESLCGDFNMEEL